MKAAKKPLNTAFRLTSNDGWKNASINGQKSAGDVFATTCTLRDGQIYVPHTMLHVLFNSKTKQ
jgi:hypothetical protein